MKRFRLLLLGLLLVGTPAEGQLYEDRMEPDELGFRDLEGIVIPPDVYVGTDVCAGCHASAYRVWIGTRHARAAVPMRSRIAMKIAMRAGTTTEAPGSSGICLSCHATGHNVPAAYRDSTFRMMEGVTCERCHGPGARHVEAAKRGDGTQKRYMTLPSSELCGGCHLAKATHAMDCEACHGPRDEHVEVMADRSPASARVLSVTEGVKCYACHEPGASHGFLLGVGEFDFEKALKRIAHPRPADGGQ